MSGLAFGEPTFSATLDGGRPETEDPAAATAPLDPELALFQLSDVLVDAASKVGQSIREAPAIESVVTRKQIDDYGWFSLNDILYSLPGYSPFQDFERSTVSARGSIQNWNNNDLLLLIDGVPYNESIYGTALTSEVTPLTLVKSIEILRDPGSALYGSNAMNGVIAMKTLSALDSPTTADVKLRVGTEATDTVDAVALANTEHVGVVVGFNYYKTNGDSYSSTDGSGTIDPTTGQLAAYTVSEARHSDYEYLKLEGKGLLRGLTLTLQNQDWNFQTGHGWLFYIPDHQDGMNQSRQLISLSYHPPATGQFQQEYVLRYQYDGIDWNDRLLPNNASYYGITYPAGISERLVSHAQDLFARAQLTVKPWLDSSAVVGVEYDGFLYTGDAEHYSNADLTFANGTAAPLSGDVKLPPWLGYITGQPVSNIGVYGQVASGRVLDKLVSATAGLRYDHELFTYHDPIDQSQDRTNGGYGEWSPRGALILYPAEAVTVKLLAGKAFRAPSPAELFGANTFFLASNVNLKPETIVTYEALVDWKLLNDIHWRTDGFYRESNNQIAYGAENENENLLSSDTAGLETEVIADYKLGTFATLGGFANYTYTALVSETILDPTYSPSSQLTWFPAHMANFGVSFGTHGFNLSVQGHVQGSVLRRASDNAVPTFVSYRPSELSPWFRLDARLCYQVTTWAQVGVQSSNLLDTDNPLIKIGAYPFDYQQPGRQVFGTVEVKL